ncbi:hypothetical protein [Nonomuraea sp. NPDC050202]|uniref:hypothetical protein n=1 Tax=Nonomuraea sp. NPDC050202 TaxID=3155035 RepID=UPI0033D9AA14
MVATASVVTPAVAAAAAVVTLVNVQEFKRRWLPSQLPKEIARPVHRTYSPGVAVLLGAIGVGITSLLAPLLARLGHAGTAGIVLGSVLGLALGVAGLSFLGLGAAAHALLWPLDPLIVYGWAAPLAAGGIVRSLHLAEHDRRGAWGMIVMMNRYGPVIRGTAPAEPFWRAAGLLGGLAPLAVVVVAGQGLGLADRAALVAAGVLVAVQAAWTDVRSLVIPERLSRLIRLACTALLRCGWACTGKPFPSPASSAWSRNSPTSTPSPTAGTTASATPNRPQRCSPATLRSRRR